MTMDFLIQIHAMSNSFDGTSQVIGTSQEIPQWNTGKLSKAP